METRQRHLSQAGDRQKSDGYTLVELLVVLVIIALLISAAPAIISAGRPDVDARAAAFQLANQLREARNASILENSNHTFTIDPIAKIALIVPGGRPIPIAPDVIIETRGGLETPASGMQLNFYADGSSQNGSIRVISGTRSYVIVNHGLIGKVTIDE